MHAQVAVGGDLPHQDAQQALHRVGVSIPGALDAVAEPARPIDPREAMNAPAKDPASPRKTPGDRGSSWQATRNGSSVNIATGSLWDR